MYLAGGGEATDVTSVLDMDSQQYSFDLSLNQLDSAELAAFGTALSENLSSGLSISDSNKVCITLKVHIYHVDIIKNVQKNKFLLNVARNEQRNKPRGEQYRREQ